MDKTKPAAHHMPAVLLLHGQPGSPSDWRSVAALLEGTGEILIPDRPGYGDSPLPAGDFEFNAKAMVDLLDSKGIGQAVVVGYSWSGGVAIEMAAKYPERVAAMVLVSSIGPGAVGLADTLMVVPGVSRLAAGVAVRLGGAAFHPRMGRPLNLLLESRLRNAAKSILNRDKQRRLAQTFTVEQKAMVNRISDLVGSLRSIKAPTIIVHARNDRFISYRVARALNGKIGGSELREVVKGSHYLPHHSAPEVAAAINSLVASINNS